MANRNSALCSKAIREAWEDERELVLEGRGTRDWTPEQQADIVDGVTPKDENGKVFEGHHMRSAEAYPEEQGDPGNVQFLTRAEHQAAHGNDFRNETSAYYDPATHQSYPVDGPVCKPEIELSNPTEVYNEEEELDVNQSGEETESESVSESESESVSESVDESISM